MRKFRFVSLVSTRGIIDILIFFIKRWEYDNLMVQELVSKVAVLLYVENTSLSFLPFTTVYIRLRKSNIVIMSSLALPFEFVQSLAQPPLLWTLSVFASHHEAKLCIIIQCICIYPFVIEIFIHLNSFIFNISFPSLIYFVILLYFIVNKNCEPCKFDHKILILFESFLLPQNHILKVQ